MKNNYQYELVTGQGLFQNDNYVNITKDYPGMGVKQWGYIRIGDLPVEDEKFNDSMRVLFCVFNHYSLVKPTEVLEFMRQITKAIEINRGGFDNAND
jgi:hypothetical protein|nr:MAG TPA: hypothetical protein [Caudoviricetes sp.]